MSDMNQALQQAGVKAVTKFVPKDRYEQPPTIQFRDKAEREEAIKALRTEVEEGNKFAAHIGPQMYQAVADWVEFDEDLNPHTRAEVQRIKDWLAFHVEDEDPRFRAISRAAFGMALIQYQLDERKEVVRLSEVNALILQRLDGFLLIRDDESGTVRMFGRRYSLSGHLAGLPMAAKAVRVLGALLNVAGNNERTIEREERKQLLGTTTPGLTVAGLAAGNVGFVHAFVLPQDGRRFNKSGSLFWRGNDTGVWIEAAFTGARRFCQRERLVDLAIPHKVANETVWADVSQKPELNARARGIWKLFRESLEIEAKKAAQKSPPQEEEAVQAEEFSCVCGEFEGASQAELDAHVLTHGGTASEAPAVPETGSASEVPVTEPTPVPAAPVAKASPKVFKYPCPISDCTEGRDTKAELAKHLRSHT